MALRNAQSAAASMDADARAEELKQLANKAVARSDMATAVKHLSEAIELKPRLCVLWVNRSFAWSVLGKHAESLADAEQCVALDARNTKGHLRIGRALIALGRAAEAAKLLEAASDTYPQDYPLQEALVDAEAAVEAGGASGGGGGGGGGGLAVALVAAVRGGARGRVGVGVDVESARRRPSERLARRVLAPVEREAFEADLAEISPRSTEISRRCGRDAAEMRPRCSRGVAEG